MDSVSLIDSSKGFTDTEVRLDGLDPWRLTGFYGELDRGRHSEF